MGGGRVVFFKQGLLYDPDLNLSFLQEIFDFVWLEPGIIFFR